jgi:hypothetical protein
VINSTVQELRDFVLSGRKDLLACKPSSQPGRAWLEAHSALIDETLRRIYHEAWRIARAAQQTSHDAAAEDSPEYSHGYSYDHEPELALLAIGGYGRAELCPYSDIDIAFVPAEEEHPLLDAVIKEAFRLVVEVLIDGAKLDVATLIVRLRIAFISITPEKPRCSNRASLWAASACTGECAKSCATRGTPSNFCSIKPKSAASCRARFACRCMLSSRT